MKYIDVSSVYYWRPYHGLDEKENSITLWLYNDDKSKTQLFRVELGNLKGAFEYANENDLSGSELREFKSYSRDLRDGKREYFIANIDFPCNTLDYEELNKVVGLDALGLADIEYVISPPEEIVVFAADIDLYDIDSITSFVSKLYKDLTNENCPFSLIEVLTKEEAISLYDNIDFSKGYVTLDDLNLLLSESDDE